MIEGRIIIFLGRCDYGRIPVDSKDFLAPYHNLGVLEGTKSFRDDNALTEGDLGLGLDQSPNNLIIIHWPCMGSFNWSYGINKNQYYDSYSTVKQNTAPRSDR